MQKIYPHAEAALAGLLFDNMTICAGGFGLCGIPERSIDAIRDSEIKALTVIQTTLALTMRAWASCSEHARCER